MNDITRLRGEGPPLVWPPAIKPVIRRLAELCEAKPPQQPRARDEWQRALDAARRRADALFADEQGWRVRSEFDYSRLLRSRGNSWIPAWATHDVFDHPSFYKKPYGDIAMIIQPYRPLCHDEIPEAITVDLLPESWWWPFSVSQWPNGLRSSAYVLRPPPKAAK